MLERNKDACATLRANFPDAEVMEEDIRIVEPAEILRRAELHPGEAESPSWADRPARHSPSRATRLAEKREGADPDADLLGTTLPVLAEARPRTFILENVFGLAYLMGAGQRALVGAPARRRGATRLPGTAPRPARRRLRRARASAARLHCRRSRLPAGASGGHPQQRAARAPRLRPQPPPAPDRWRGNR